MGLQGSVIMFALATILSISNAHIGGGQILYQHIKPQVYCGRNLARTLAMLCFDDITVKRSDQGTMYNSILSPYYKDQDNQVGWPWIPPQKARSLELPNRGKRFVVSECCEKACSIEELLSYC